jgi:hypothetical protein
MTRLAGQFLPRRPGRAGPRWIPAWPSWVLFWLSRFLPRACWRVWRACYAIGHDRCCSRCELGFATVVDSFAASRKPPVRRAVEPQPALLLPLNDSGRLAWERNYIRRFLQSLLRSLVRHYSQQIRYKHRNNQVHLCGQCHQRQCCQFLRYPC